MTELGSALLRKVERQRLSVEKMRVMRIESRAVLDKSEDDNATVRTLLTLMQSLMLFLQLLLKVAKREAANRDF